MDDLAWDAGDMGRALQRPISTPLEEPTSSPFARLAQASLLISKAMAHCRRAVGQYNDSDSSHNTASGNNNNNNNNNNNKEVPSPGNGGGGGDGDDVDMTNGAQDGDDPTTTTTPLNIREVTTIIAELKSFCQAIEREMATASATLGDAMYLAYIPARCLSWSTAIMVLDLYSCPEHMRAGAGSGAPGRGAAELAMQVESINGLKTAGLRVQAIALDVLGALEEEAMNGFMPWSSISVAGRKISLTDCNGEAEGVRIADRLSPLCMDALYCGMSTFHWLWRENGDPEMKQGLDTIRNCLDKMSERWKLAREYLEIEKRHDVEALLRLNSDGARGGG